LIGIPHRIVVSERGLKEGQLEYQARADNKVHKLALQNAVDHLKSLLS
jgi:prolyl-tRNA synthetase